MTEYKFKVGEGYAKTDIYRICSVPEAKQKGNWNTGYTNYKGDWFIFCNVGVAGRTGHDYENRFIDDELVWYGKSKSHVGQESIKSLIDPASNVYVFYREEDRAPFTFAGIAKAKNYQASMPVRVTWSFLGIIDSCLEVLAEEVVDSECCIEGATKTISVNTYERNPQARAACLAAHGYNCVVCGFDFENEYGEIGKDYIHVHHLKQLADIGVEYELNPVEDLRPVCPNCHSMLHRKRPAFSVQELQQIRSAKNKSMRGLSK